MLRSTRLADPRGPADIIGDAFALSYDHGRDVTTALDVLRAGMTHLYPTGGAARGRFDTNISVLQSYR